MEGKKVIRVIDSNRLRTNQARCDKSAITNDRLHFEQSDVICAIHSPAISTIHDSRLIDGRGGGVSARWWDEWADREKRNGRATEWRPVIGTVCQESDTIERHIWRENSADGFSYIISMKYSVAVDDTPGENRNVPFNLVILWIWKSVTSNWAISANFGSDEFLENFQTANNK